MPPKKKIRKPIPPCPDPLLYVWVNSKEGGYWRKRKGIDSPAKINDVIALSATLTRPTNEAAKRVVSLLKEFTKYMVPGRLTVRIAGAFKRSYLAKGKMDFSSLQGFEFHKGYPFDKLCRGNLIVKEEKGTLQIQVQVGDLLVVKQSGIVTGYHLTAILLHGDPAKENGLLIEAEEPQFYSFEKDGDGRSVADCSFSVILPARKRPWMVLLSIVCDLELGTPPSPTNCRMKVVKTGGG